MKLINLFGVKTPEKRSLTAKDIFHCCGRYIDGYARRTRKMSFECSKCGSKFYIPYKDMHIYHDVLVAINPINCVNQYSYYKDMEHELNYVKAALSGEECEFNETC